MFTIGEEQGVLPSGKTVPVHNKVWKERGIGELKILLSSETGKHRFVMRRDVAKKLFTTTTSRKTRGFKRTRVVS